MIPLDPKQLEAVRDLVLTAAAVYEIEAAEILKNYYFEPGSRSATRGDRLLPREARSIVSMIARDAFELTYHQIATVFQRRSESWGFNMILLGRKLSEREEVRARIRKIGRILTT